MARQKKSVYEVPEVIMLHLPDVTYRRGLVDYYYGDPERWTPEAGFISLAIRARSADTYEPTWERVCRASVLGEWVRDNYDLACYVEAGWRKGNAGAFWEWLQGYEQDEFFGARLEEVLGDADEGWVADCGGGSYGFTVARYGPIVIAHDTEGHYYVFPPNTDTGPEVIVEEEAEEE